MRFACSMSEVLKHWRQHVHLTINDIYIQITAFFLSYGILTLGLLDWFIEACPLHFISQEELAAGKCLQRHYVRIVLCILQEDVSMLYAYLSLLSAVLFLQLLAAL